MSAPRVIVITGAGRGIGRGLAGHFAARGDAVVLNDSGVALDGTSGDPELVLREAEALTAAGGRALGVPGSIGEPGTAAAIAEQALAAFGAIDVWINGAAILRGRMLFNMSDEEWSSVLRTTLDGTFFGMRAAMKQMKEQKRGRVINLLSAAGLIGNVGVAGYAAAKGGIAALTRVGALEGRRFGIAVNAVVPFARTRMTDTMKGGTPEMDAYLAGARAAQVEHLFPLFDCLVDTLEPGISGQIFGARGHGVFLFPGQRPAAVVRRAEGWTADALAAVMEERFRPRYAPLETELEVFSEDPLAGEAP